MREFTVRSKAVFLSGGGGGGGPICYLCFILIISLNYAVLTLSCGLVVTCWDWLASCAWCFLVGLFAFSCGARVWCGAWLYHSSMGCVCKDPSF